MTKRSEVGAVGDTAPTKPRGAGEVGEELLLEVYADVTHPNGGGAVLEFGLTDAGRAILTAWRREIEAAMVERIAAWFDQQEKGTAADRWSVECIVTTIRARFGGGE